MKKQGLTQRMTRREVLRAAGTLAAAGMLAACQPKAAEQGEPTIVRETVLVPATAAPQQVTTGEGKIIYSSWGGETRLRSDEQNIDAFMQKHPEIKVEFMPMVGDEYPQLMTMIAAGTPVDVPRLDRLYTKGMFARGAYRSLDDLFDMEGIVPEDLFVPPFEQCTWKGQWYGILRGATGADVIYYNKEMFDKEGIPYPNDPNWTWDDFLELCRAFAKDTNGDGKMDQWGLYGAQFWVGGFYSRALNNGGGVLSEDKAQCILDKPETIEAAQWCADVTCQFHVAPRATEVPEGVGNTFLGGIAAMDWTGAFAINEYRAGASFDWGVTYTPGGPKSHITWSAPNTCSISSETKYPEACWELLKYLISEECQKHDADEGLWGPCTRALMYSDWYRKSDKPPYDLTPTVSGLLHPITTFPLTMNWREIYQAINQELAEMKTCGETAAQALPRAKQKVDELLSQAERE